MKETSGLVNNFTLESCKLANHSEESEIFMGQRINKQCGDQYFYFRLLANSDKFETFQNNIKTKPAMNVRFHENRTTFLCQHLALSYIHKHNLVDCLINHDFYGRNMPENPVNIDNYFFQ